MADQHNFVVDFVEDYEQQVVFYIGTLTDYDTTVDKEVKSGHSQQLDDQPQGTPQEAGPPATITASQEQEQGKRPDDAETKDIASGSEAGAPTQEPKVADHAQNSTPEGSRGEEGATTGGDCGKDIQGEGAQTPGVASQVVVEAVEEESRTSVTHLEAAGLTISVTHPESQDETVVVGEAKQSETHNSDHSDINHPAEQRDSSSDVTTNVACSSSVTTTTTTEMTSVESSQDTTESQVSVVETRSESSSVVKEETTAAAETSGEVSQVQTTRTEESVSETQESRFESQISVDKLRDEIQALRAQTESQVVQLEADIEARAMEKKCEQSHTGILQVRKITAEHIVEPTEKQEEEPAKEQKEDPSQESAADHEHEASKQRVMNEFAKTERMFCEQFLQPSNLTLPLDGVVLPTSPSVTSPVPKDGAVLPTSPSVTSPVPKDGVVLPTSPPVTVTSSVWKETMPQAPVLGRSVSTPAPRTPLSPGAGPPAPAVGLDHLNNLLKIMDTLSTLRVQNMSLHKKCSYLQETKSLLRVQNEMLQYREHCRIKSRSVKSTSHKVMQYLAPSNKTRDRAPSDSPDSGTTNSDHNRNHEASKKPTNGKPATPKLHHRSQSVGSIDLAEILAAGESTDSVKPKSAEKEGSAPRQSQQSRGHGMRLEKTKSRKFLKWQSRMKKVFSPNKAEAGHKSSQDSASITAEQLVRVNSKHPHHPQQQQQQQQQKPPALVTMKSLDASMIPASFYAETPTHPLCKEDKSASRSDPHIAGEPSSPISLLAGLPFDSDMGSVKETAIIDSDEGSPTTDDAVPKVTGAAAAAVANTETEAVVKVSESSREAGSDVGGVPKVTDGAVISEGLPPVIAGNDADLSKAIEKDHGVTTCDNAPGAGDVSKVPSGIPEAVAQVSSSDTPATESQSHTQEAPPAAGIDHGGGEGSSRDLRPPPLNIDLLKQCSAPTFETQGPVSPPLKTSCSAGSLASQEIANLFSKPDVAAHSTSDHEGETKDDQASKPDLDRPLVRRKSSPTLGVHTPADLSTLPNLRFGRSASFRIKKSKPDHGPDASRLPAQVSKSTPGSPNDGSMSPTSQDEQCRPHHAVSALGRRGYRSAWGRVKDIIHTRKDSLKRDGGRRSRRTLSSDSHLRQELEADLSSDPGPSTFEWDIKENERWDTEGAGHSGASVTGDDSPRSKRKSMTSDGGSPPGRRKASGMSVDVTALMANSFTFEESAAPGGTSPAVSKDFIKKMEEWTKMKSSLQRGSIKEEQLAPPGSASSSEGTRHGIQELQKTLSSTFTKTVQEITGRRSREGGSPVHDRKVSPDARSRKEERSKSRDRERDRSRQKYEREIAKIEKKEQKIEKEKQRLEKLKLKMRADASYESSSSSDQGMSQEFLKKLQEWDSMKSGIGFKLEAAHEAQPTENVPTRSKSQKGARETSPCVQRERVCSDSSLMTMQLSPPGLSSSSPTSPESPLPVEAPTASQTEPASLAHQFGQKVMDESLHNDLTLTLEDFFSLEDSNKQLLYEVQQKDEDIMLLQDELRQMTERINCLNKDYSEDMALCRQELWATSRIGRYTIETDLMSSTLNDLQDKIEQMQEYGERIASEKQQMEVKNIQEARKRMEAENKLLEEIEKLQLTLDKKTLRGGKEVFEQLYQFVIKVQGQLNDLKLGVMERNRMLEELERHLLVQEVTNRLMQAELEQRDTRLRYFRTSRKNGVIRRWKTFAGMDMDIRQNGAVRVKKTRYPIVPRSHKEVQRMVHSLSHSSLNSLDLHLEWLEGLKKDVQDREAMEVSSRAVQVDHDKPDCSTTLVQTVMTLCHCTYVPQARYLTEEGATVSASETREVQTEEPDNRVETAVQASEPEVCSCEVEVQTDPVPETPAQVVEQVVAASKEPEQVVEQVVAASKEPEQVVEQVVAASEEPKQVVEQVVTASEDKVENSVNDVMTVEEHTFTLNAPVSEAEDTFTVTLPETSAENTSTFTMSTPEVVTEDSFTVTVPDSTVEDTFTFVAPEPEEKKESESVSAMQTISQIVVTKPEETNTNVEFTFTFSLDGENKDKDDASETQTADTSVDAEVTISAVVETKNDEDGTPDGDNVPFAEHLRRRMSAGNDALDVSRPPQPPHSPLIRSKYPRKNRPDFRLHQMYIDTRTWKATPPRRTSRPHRKNNANKPYHSRSVERSSDKGSVESLQTSSIRDRTSSDCSMLQHMTCTVPGKERDELTVRHTRSLGLNMSSPGSPTSSIDPFSRDVWFRKSPTPGMHKPMRSPVRRLKSAAELLQDSENRRHSRSTSHDDVMLREPDDVTLRGMSTSISSSSSDKENEKQQKEVTESVVEAEMTEPVLAAKPPIHPTMSAPVVCVEAVEEVKEERVQKTQAPKPAQKEKAPSHSPKKDKAEKAPSHPQKREKTVTPQVKKEKTPSPPPSPTPTPPADESKTNSKPPLKDKTNESKVKKMKALLSGGGQADTSVRSKQKSRPEVVKVKEKPKQGLVARQAELFQSKTKSETPGLSQTCKTKAVTVTVTPRNTPSKAKSESAITALDADSSSKSTGSQQGEDADRMSASSAEGSVTKKGQGSPSPSGKESKGHKLFGKKSSGGSQSPKGGRGSPKKPVSRKGSTSSQKGAISALCASAMSLEVDEDGQPKPSTSQSQDSPEGARSREESVERKKRNKFLDGNWLQKPKKFFKASKC